jgi:hypothetical protein
LRPIRSCFISHLYHPSPFRCLYTIFPLFRLWVKGFDTVCALQPQTAKEILSAKADYVLSVKRTSKTSMRM